VTFRSSVVRLAAAALCCAAVAPADTAGARAQSPQAFEGESMRLAAAWGKVMRSPSASGGRFLNVWSTAFATRTVTAAGGDRIVVRARGTACQGAPVLAVRVNGARVAALAVRTPVWRSHAVRARVPAGRVAIAVGLANDRRTSPRCDRNLHVDTVAVHGDGRDEGAAPATPSPSPSAPGSAAPAPPVASTPGPGWRLTFADEFDGATLDRSRWAADWGASFSRPTEFLPGQLQVGAGRLRITAERKPTPSGRPWAGGLINSHGRFEQRYGRFEMRAKVPTGRALWPSFWLMPADKRAWPPEIDVVEMRGQEPGKVFMTYHYLDGAGAHRSVQGRHTGPDLSTGFHTFALEWSPGLLVWEVDGVERHRTTTAVTDQPMYLLANLAVGASGDPGDWIGMPDDSTADGAHMDIDHIRAWARE